MVMPAGRVPIRIRIAGQVVQDAADEVIAYLEGRNHGTQNRIQDFDHAAYLGRLATPLTITKATINSANKLRAQMGRNYTGPGTPLTGWLQPQQLTTPWNILTTAHTFMNADPSVCGGIYDDFCAIWYNFYPMHVQGRRNGISTAKINKVLHQLVPDFFPIVDSKVLNLYYNMLFQGAARSICARVVANRANAGCANPFNDGFLYEPIRQDMRNINFTAIRQQVSVMPCNNSLLIAGQPANVWAAANLSDVRIFDMIAWQL